MGDQKQKVIYNGREYDDINTLCKSYGISVQNVYHAKQKGKTLTQAISEQLRKKHMAAAGVIVDEILRKIEKGKPITWKEKEQLVGFFISDLAKYLSTVIEDIPGWRRICQDAEIIQQKEWNTKYIAYALAEEILGTQQKELANHYVHNKGITRNTGVLAIVRQGRGWEILTRRYIKTLREEVETRREDEIYRWRKHQYVEDLGEDLAMLLEPFDEQEKEVLYLKYGFDGEGFKKDIEVAKILGITSESVRQIDAHALRKLRHPTRTRQLREYLDNWEMIYW